MGLSAPTPNLEDQGIPFRLSGMGGPASSYTTAGIALRIIWLRKPHHYVKVEIPSVGGGGKGVLITLNTLDIISKFRIITKFIILYM
jgi:hypothetical protein